jgi:ubiquitin-protein ligase E3 C
VQVWTAPELAGQLSSANRAALLRPGPLAQLLAGLRRAAGSGQLGGLPAMWALANTVQLLAAGGGGAALADLATAEAFSGMATQLLAAAAGWKGAGGGSAGWAPALNAAGPLADQPMLLQLLATLGQQQMPLFVRLCVQLVHALPEACERCGPSAAGGGQADAAASGSSRGGAGAAQQQQQRQQRQQPQQEPRLSVPSALNALAFSPPVLPQLWRWLAQDLGLPLEAPYEASRGLDVASLKGGAAALAPHHAVALGLFCRRGPPGTLPAQPASQPASHCTPAKPSLRLQPCARSFP